MKPLKTPEPIHSSNFSRRQVLQATAATVAAHDLLRYAGGSSAGNMLHGLGNLGVWYPIVPQFKAIAPLPLPGPMDGADADGEPWISDDVKIRVREKLGLIRRTGTGGMSTDGGPVPLGKPPTPARQSQSSLRRSTRRLAGGDRAPRTGPRFVPIDCFALARSTAPRTRGPYRDPAPWCDR